MSTSNNGPRSTAGRRLPATGPSPMRPGGHYVDEAVRQAARKAIGRTPDHPYDLSGGQSRLSIPRGAYYRDAQGNTRRNDNFNRGNPIVRSLGKHRSPMDLSLSGRTPAPQLTGSGLAKMRPANLPGEIGGVGVTGGASQGDHGDKITSGASFGSPEIRLSNESRGDGVAGKVNVGRSRDGRPAVTGEVVVTADPRHNDQDRFAKHLNRVTAAGGHREREQMAERADQGGGSTKGFAPLLGGVGIGLGYSQGKHGRLVYVGSGYGGPDFELSTESQEPGVVYDLGVGVGTGSGKARLGRVKPKLSGTVGVWFDPTIDARGSFARKYERRFGRRPY